MFQKKVVEKHKTHNLCPITSENRTVLEIMWRDIAKPGRPQLTIYGACWITKATDTHSE
jgi:hypothetical protein